MPLNIISLPAEHHEKDGKRIPLCSRVARKNLGILLGIAPDKLSSYDVYKSLDFAPFGTAFQVHDMYRKGWRSPSMVGPYQYAESYGENLWNPPDGAIYADIFFSTPAGHRCVAFLGKDQHWYILDPYYDNLEVAPQYFPFPFETYCAMLYFRKGALIEGVAFYKAGRPREK